MTMSLGNNRKLTGIEELIAIHNDDHLFIDRRQTLYDIRSDGSTTIRCGLHVCVAHVVDVRHCVHHDTHDATAVVVRYPQDNDHGGRPIGQARQAKTLSQVNNGDDGAAQVHDTPDVLGGVGQGGHSIPTTDFLHTQD